MRFSYGAVKESQRRAIFVVRAEDAVLSLEDIEDIAERMREKLASRGELAADVVVVQGNSKETLQLHGNSFSVSRVRAAMFNAALNWMPIEL
jgi:translation initiation factor 1 (eIF-1/SUI1)